MKEAEIEEAENFIPCCFRVMRDRHGNTLKVRKLNLSKLNKLIQESSISIEHFRFIMKSLPVGAWNSRRGAFSIFDIFWNIRVLEMNAVVDQMLVDADVGDEGIKYQEFVRMMKKY